MEKQVRKTTHSPKRVPLKAPPKLSEEIEALFASNDFTELEYHNIEALRKRRELTREQKRRT